MRDSTLFAVALSISLIGITVLFFISDELALEEVDHIDTLVPDQHVKITGRIISIRQNENVAFLTIAHENIEEIPIVLFKPRYLTLSEDQYVEIEGTVDEYEGKKQIIGNSVRLR
jgi:DNA/RNA endonuclease YhcR with UshA esterase domain